MTVGLLSFAPVYLNGVLALLCVFVLPGLAFVRAIDVPNFPQRLLVIFLGSLAANHFLSCAHSYAWSRSAAYLSILCLTLGHYLGQPCNLGRIQPESALQNEA